MLLEDARLALCAYGRRAVDDGFVVGSSGNLSVRRDGTASGGRDLVAVTPGGYPLDRLTPADCAVVDRATGEIVDGVRPPSSETPMHLALYDTAPDARAIVHTHAVFGAVVSTTRPALPAIHYNVLLFGGRDVRVADYATYGTPELAENVRAALAGGRTAALLANHGGVTLGGDLDEAYERTRILEWLCQVYVRACAMGGEPRLLGPDELAGVERRMGLVGWDEPGRTGARGVPGPA
ncbi:class II aldolase/adducin family protein [Yinghuangia seranimata]|uniref:class II aldolase/adducin family protein n=1 Tax=Yinghuangia seranimata TaxID=408067 RepID=UPI00248CB695|nr:class II aldolase/adducin family protein [Yinghuangia seranimata]MDI2132137.1 class II aldolase/adducin family protein [Yinghuangia seranimata]